MALLEESDRLRQLLGEEIPDGSDAGDTLFKDSEIEDFLERAGGNAERAAYEGWRVKAAKLSSLVDNTEGNVQRKFSQLLTNANIMIKVYAKASDGPTEGRTRVGRIRRGPVEW